ncbi:MAG: rRNA maturation RNase YbeY [Planctomycetota bacterium]|nr:rRNA maturation RNase YbeY [Planctomycetota bacterium]
MSLLRRTHARRGHRGRDPEVPGAKTRRRGKPAQATTGRAPPVDVQWVGSRPFLSGAEIRRTARAALREGGRPRLRVSIAVVPDRQLTRLHAEWLGDPTPTDVLSFDLSDDLSEAGEIVASHTCARRTARQRGVAAGRELALYVVHGILHLCGHDDHTRSDRAAMRAAEERVLGSLGWPSDLAPHDEVAKRSRRAP